MACNEQLAQRVRVQMSTIPGMVEKKMFGGTGFLVNGNMACGVHGENLIVRLGLEQSDEALTREGVKEFDMTGRPMKGWGLVSSTGHEAEADFQSWLQRGIRFAQSLPAK